MPDLDFPSSDFTAELTAGSAKAAAKSADAKSGTVYKVPVDQLHVLPEFNTRVVGTKDYTDHVNFLVGSIRENGYDESKPLSVFVRKIDDEDRFYVVDGHSRLAAVKKLNANGGEIATVPVVVKPAGTSLMDLTVGLITSNEGKPLGTYERAIVAKRLTGYGMSTEDIATRIGKTPRHVRDLLKLAGAPEKIRKLIVNGNLTTTDALRLMTEHGEDAGDVAEAAVAEAASEGRTQATQRHIARMKTDVVKSEFKFKKDVVYGAQDPGIDLARMLNEALLKKVKGGYRAVEAFKVFASVSRKVPDDGDETPESEAGEHDGGDVLPEGSESDVDPDAGESEEEDPDLGGL